MTPTRTHLRHQTKIVPAMKSLLWFCAILGIVCPTNAQTLSCGDVVQGTIAVLGQTNSYTFNASSGEVIRITSSGNSGGVGPDIEVWYGANYVGGFGHNDGFSTLPLPSTGNYTIRVYDRDNDNTGTYSLGLVWATAKCGVAVTCGQVVSDSLTNSVQQHTYSLAAVAGDKVRITTPIKSAVCADVDVFNSVGVFLGWFGCNDGFSTLTLTNTDTYTLIVRDRDNNNTGDYTLGVVFSTPKCAVTPLLCDESITNTIIDPAQQHMYVLNGFAGEVIRLTSAPLSGGLAPDVDVFNSGGMFVGGFGYNDFASTLTITNSGVYTVVVRDRANANTGDYALTLDVMGGCVRLLIGSTVVRTQTVGCVTLTSLAAAPAVGLGFSVSAPPGHLSNVNLDTGSRFVSSVLTPMSASQWFVSLQASPALPLAGEEVIGSLCFTATNTESAFVPITVNNFAATNVDGLIPSTDAFGGRVVVIAVKPLLEAWLGSAKQRMVTTYGLPNTGYEIRHASALGLTPPWPVGLTNLVPASMFYSQPLTGTLSNAPVLFLRANEH